MIISNNQVQNILKTYSKQLNNNKVNQTESSKKVGKTDNLAISSESKIKQKVMQAIKNTDEIRADKINELKEQVATGTYTISDDEVAEKMITRAIVDHLV